MNIIEAIMRGCGCAEENAKEYLSFEIKNLRELRDANDLRYQDFVDTCHGLGLDEDYIPYFTMQLA